MNFIVACCHSAKLCAYAARAFPIATLVKLFADNGLNLLATTFLVRSWHRECEVCSVGNWATRNLRPYQSLLWKLLKAIIVSRNVLSHTHERL